MKTSDLSAIFLAVIAATLLIHGFVRDSWQILLVGVVAAIGAGWMLFEPDMKSRRAGAESKKEDHSQSDSGNDRSAADQVPLFAIPQNSMPSQAQRALEQELRTARESAAESKREIAKWQQTSIEYLDFLDYILGLDGVDEKCSQAFRKARVELIKKMAERGIVEIRPKAGDAFDDRLNVAADASEIEGSEGQVIESVEKSGFSIGSKVIRPAKVHIGKT